MALPRKLAFAACMVLLVGLPLAAQGIAPQPPCRATENPPDHKIESNPTTRDAVVTHSDVGTTNRTVTAQACLVVGTQEPIQPGQAIGKPPSNGLHFDWNLALVSEAGRIVAVWGTVSNTGALTPATDPFTLPISLSFNLSSDQPNPSTNRLFTQVGVWPCQDLTSACNPDQSQQRQFTRLLGSPGTSDPDYSPGTYRPNSSSKRKLGPGCFEPRRPGEPDVALRQVTAIAIDNTYFIYACMVSFTYKSLALASFDIEPQDDHGVDLAQYPGAGGNTRLNVGKLYAQPGPHWDTPPAVVTVLATQISSIAPIAANAPVKSAIIHADYQACKDENETLATCAPATGRQLYSYPWDIDFFVQP